MFVTLGGGGFSMADGATPIDRYLLERTGKASPLVCFIPTASADSADYCRRFRAAFDTLGVPTAVLTLWEDAAVSVERLADADLVYVGGGSTLNLLALWRAHGVDQLLADLAGRVGTVLAGISAGANCWYEGSSTDSFGPELRPLRDGLGLLPGSFCPHFDGEPGRRESFQRWIRDDELPPGWAADDGAALVWEGGKIKACLSERADAQAYRVDREGIRAMEMTQLS